MPLSGSIGESGTVIGAGSDKVRYYTSMEMGSLDNVGRNRPRHRGEDVTAMRNAASDMNETVSKVYQDIAAAVGSEPQSDADTVLRNACLSSSRDYQKYMGEESRLNADEIKQEVLVHFFGDPSRQLEGWLSALNKKYKPGEAWLGTRTQQMRDVLVKHKLIDAPSA